MQREIKFRFWYANANHFMYRVFTLEETMNGCPFDVLSDNPLMKNWRMLPERDQWTGMTDNSGVEIFENDFVEFGGKGIVSYHEDRFFVDCFNVHTRVSSLCQVVGNKIQNQEFMPF